MSTSLLCETVTGQTMAQLIRARDGADAADMVELRLDGVTGLDVAAALAGRRAPVIVTCRPAWEGGRFNGTEAERQTILQRALDGGADYVDVELKAGFRTLIASDPDRVIVSSHDFKGVPADLSALVRKMRDTGAAVTKLAVTPVRLADTLPLIDVAEEGDVVVVGMGEAGIATRLLAARFGSRWTYAGNNAAPGQIPTRRMLDQFRYRDVGADTSIFAVVGHNVLRSPSPVMQNAAFTAASIDAVCVPLRAEDFADFLTFADAVGVVDGYLDALDDLPTLVAQAERQFEWWTGQRAAAGVMRAAAAEETAH